MSQVSGREQLSSSNQDNREGSIKGLLTKGWAGSGETGQERAMSQVITEEWLVHPGLQRQQNEGLPEPGMKESHAEI